MAKANKVPGSILATGFTTSEQKALNAFNDALDSVNGAATTAEITAAITANNANYISKALLKSTTAGAVDFAAYQAAIAAIP